MCCGSVQHIIVAVYRAVWVQHIIVAVYRAVWVPRVRRTPCRRNFFALHSNLLFLLPAALKCFYCGLKEGEVSTCCPSPVSEVFAVTILNSTHSSN